MIRMKITVILISACILAGCADKRDVTALRKANMRFANEIEQLQARVAAIEDACLQLNSQILALQNSGKGAAARETESPSAESSQSLPDGTGIKAETAVTSLSSTTPETRDKITRFSFKSSIVGMTTEKITALFGKPDQVTGNADKQNWTYGVIPLATDDGGQEYSSALIVFEKGCVSRGVLTEKLERDSAPQAQKTAPAKPRATTPSK